jgi:hypothetical protein
VKSAQFDASLAEQKAVILEIMRYRFALLERRNKIVATREGTREIGMWYLGKELLTGVAGDDSLQEALNFVLSEGWELVPEEIAADAALMRRPRE